MKILEDRKKAKLADVGYVKNTVTRLGQLLVNIGKGINGHNDEIVITELYHAKSGLENLLNNMTYTE